MPCKKVFPPPLTLPRLSHTHNIMCCLHFLEEISVGNDLHLLENEIDPVVDEKHLSREETNPLAITCNVPICKLNIKYF